MDILFQYKILPTNNFLGTDGTGTSITILHDGTVMLHSYEFHERTPIYEEIIASIPQLAESVKAIIETNKERIDAIPTFLDMGSCDGSYDIFWFGKSFISAKNIRMYDLDSIKKRYPKEYHELYDKMCYENTVLEIYSEITDVLKGYSIDFSELNKSLVSKSRSILASSSESTSSSQNTTACEFPTEKIE